MATMIIKGKAMKSVDVDWNEFYYTNCPLISASNVDQELGWVKDFKKINPHFPALRANPLALSGASRRKQSSHNRQSVDFTDHDKMAAFPVPNGAQPRGPYPGSGGFADVGADIFTHRRAAAA